MKITLYQMTFTNRIMLGFLVAFSAIASASAQTEYQIRASFSIGGVTPPGMPREIRKIESYNPGLQLGLEANATQWLSEYWGLRLGLRVEGKGMSTNARVKSYVTEIIHDNSRIKGYFTGKVKTHVSNTYISVPILVTYRFSQTWKLYGGLYVSGAMSRAFDGHVSNGYLRQDTPIGTRINFEDGGRASYDFSDHISRFQWGPQIGGEWLMKRHLVLFGDFTYGVNSVLKKESKVVSFAMHNAYLNLGFGYRF